MQLAWQINRRRQQQGAYSTENGVALRRTAMSTQQGASSAVPAQRSDPAPTPEKPTETDTLIPTADDAESGAAAEPKAERKKWSEDDQPWNKTGKHIDMGYSKHLGVGGQWAACILAVAVLAGYIGYFGLLPTGPATLIVRETRERSLAAAAAALLGLHQCAAR